MFVKIDNTNYFVNPDKYNGTESKITNDVVEEIIGRMDIKFMTTAEKEKLRKKIYNRYQEAKKQNLPFY